ncbi:MAG: serine/threonine protein kinase [Pontiellaceae bacterium]|nr:serine/threonine protein kinase [Pontiellaceae bacterium]MBN2786063.1 serine/threonine protein kinase [Pontiellaceae bacterium]
MDAEPTSESMERRAEEILCEALDYDSGEERTVFLNKACDGNPALMDAVEQLLSLEDDADTFFDNAAPSDLSVTKITQSLSDLPSLFGNPEVVLPDDDAVGKQIGPYKLLQKIGEGGIGNVYLAEETAPIRRQVAFKIIKLGMDTQSVIARFEAERQALAMMEHPNIARVLNAGETETGRPFFVMELVRGVRVTTYCDQQQLDLPSRLELFIQICHAIQHAHQKGIIHRDIKPSNVLVSSHDGAAMPVVIDFGIAKATHGDLLTDKTVNTLQGPFIGTPAYMSPEQASLSRVDIDTRSDIYSLGVLLYELLLGRPPFDQAKLLQCGIDEMCRMIRECEPPLPSVRYRRLNPEDRETVAQIRTVEPKWLDAHLRGDLDWIVAKALAKDRALRYTTADALAMDIARFLHNEPVLARPPGWLYRFRKMIRRNRLVCGSVAAILLALVGGLSLSIVMFLKAEEARFNEMQLRIRAEVREKVTQAALALNQGELERAERLVRDIPAEVPSIEEAAVYRQLMKWHILRGEPEKAVRYSNSLLNVNQLNDRDTQSLDLLMCSAVLSAAGESYEYNEPALNVMDRLDPNMPAPVRARMVTAALLWPADDRIVRKLFGRSRLEESIHGKSPVVSSGEDLNESLWRKLQLVGCGGVTPHQITKEDGLITFISGGADIVSSHDSFEFAYMMVEGDFDLCLRVHSVDWLDDFTRVGLMVRNHLDAPDSRQMMIAVNAGNTFQVMIRSRTGSETASMPPGPLPKTNGSNSWVRLQRVGSVFRGYISDNGSDWQLLDSYDSAIGPDGPFADSACVGIAACAHHPKKTTVAVVSDFRVVAAPAIETLMASALMYYRVGDSEPCEQLCRRALMDPEINSGQAAIIRAVLSMALEKEWNRAEALEQYRQAGDMIEKRFAQPLDAGSDSQGSWYEWIIARTLLNEAKSVLF